MYFLICFKLSTWTISFLSLLCNKHQRSSSPVSIAPGFSFLCLCFLTILWNEVFFWDGDGPDTAQNKEKQEHGNALLWSLNVFDWTKRELVLNTTGVENMTKQAQTGPWMRWEDIKKQSLYYLSGEIFDVVPTFRNFTGFLMDGGAVDLLLLWNSSPLLVKCHGAILWQAVKFLFKLLLQFPKADKWS